jgi:CheY-like chemotaxis protein
MKEQTVLIVDDEPSVRSLVKSMLKKKYRVIDAADGEEGLRVARDNKPDIVLMDIMMPKVDGYMACFAMKKDPELKDIPVVILTGVGFDLNRKLSEKFGADDYLTKPFKLQDLQRVIDKFIEAPEKA